MGSPILISHRGNLCGSIPERENQPSYIDEAIKKGYEVEIDLWVSEGKLFLGHDFPDYAVDLEWLVERKNIVWVHCKNLQALEFLNNSNSELNYFWHESDSAVLTSQGFIWAFPGNQPIKGSVAVMPESSDDNIKDLVECYGICTDHVYKYESSFITVGTI